MVFRPVTQHRFSTENVIKIHIVDGNFGQNCKLNVHRTDSRLQKRALKLQNRAEMGIFSMKKGIFNKSLLQKGFLAQNRAQKGYSSTACQWTTAVLHFCYRAFSLFLHISFFAGHIHIISTIRIHCGYQQTWQKITAN